MERREPLHWVRQDRKNEVPGRLRDIKEAEGHKGRCLFVIDENGNTCRKQENNNCHVIPKSNVLNQLKDNTGKVLELKWGVKKWQDFFIGSNESNPINLNSADEFGPQLVGTGDACVRWFACKEHDNEFGPADVGEPDFSDPILRFLCAYRAALYAADLARLGKRLLAWNRQILNSPRMEMRVEWTKVSGTLKVEIPRAQSTATRLGKIWYAWKTLGEFDPDLVSGQTLFFRSRLKFAACISYHQGLLVLVFPIEEDRHKMGLLHLAEDSDLVDRDNERLTQLCNVSESSGIYGVEVLQGIMASGSGNAAISPESYDGLSEKEKQEIREVVARHSNIEIAKACLSTQPRRSARGRKRW